jgi:hypothetical protein
MLAPAWKVIPFRATLDESETLVVLEASKVASERPFETVASIQLAAVFQSPAGRVEIPSRAAAALDANSQRKA